MPLNFLLENQQHTLPLQGTVSTRVFADTNASLLYHLNPCVSDTAAAGVVAHNLLIGCLQEVLLPILPLKSLALGSPALPSLPGHSTRYFSQPTILVETQRPCGLSPAVISRSKMSPTSQSCSRALRGRWFAGMLGKLLWSITIQ